MGARMYQQILLPIDLNQESSWEKALPVVLEFCRTFGSNLHVMTVVPDFGMAMVSQYFPESYETRMLEDANKALHGFVREHVPQGITVQHIVAQGTPYHEILRIAEEIGCDLIAMASHRPELKDYLIGPNAARVVRYAKCSVLVIRG